MIPIRRVLHRLFSPPRVLLKMPDGAMVGPAACVPPIVRDILGDDRLIPEPLRAQRAMVQDMIEAALLRFFKDVAAGDRPADWAALPRGWTPSLSPPRRTVPLRPDVALPGIGKASCRGRV